MAGRLEGKVALITGGNTGISRATSVLFAREGASVAIAARGSDEGEATVREIKDAGGEAMFIKTDVSKAADVEAAVSKAIETYGRLDIAFNNAGIQRDVHPLAEQAEEVWNEIIAINLTGVFLAMKYEIPQMLKTGGGSIVNTSSVGGLVGNYGIAPYIASKHGVIGLTKAAALDYAKHNIRINAVAPGGVETQMVTDWLPTPEARAQLAAEHPMGRISQPEETAEAVLWLCSDAASFVTGQTLAIDGGYTIQ